MTEPMGAEQARELLERVRSDGSRQAMPPLPVLRMAVAALAQQCELVLALMDSVGGEYEESPREESSGPPIFGR